MQKIRKGDQVIVITGRDKGKRGTVLRVRRRAPGRRGRERRQEAPSAESDEGRDGRHRRQGRCRSSSSNVASVNPATGKGDRVGIKLLERAASARCASSSPTAKSRKIRNGVSAQTQRRRTSEDGSTRPACRPVLPREGGARADRPSSATSRRCRCRGSRRSRSTWASARPSPTRRCSTTPSADLTKIAGQKPVVTKSQEGDRRLQDPRGLCRSACMVTLRGVRMYEFLDRLVTIALPRVRDFRGISRPRLRRPRQLQHRRQGTDHLPRDRVRQGRRAPRA